MNSELMSGQSEFLNKVGHILIRNYLTILFHHGGISGTVKYQVVALTLLLC